MIYKFKKYFSEYFYKDAVFDRIVGWLYLKSKKKFPMYSLFRFI
jgi:hypothetical protein